MPGKRGQEPIAKWPAGCCARLVPDPYSTDVERKIPAFNFRDVRSGHGGLLNAGDEQISIRARSVNTPELDSVIRTDGHKKHQETQKGTIADSAQSARPVTSKFCVFLRFLWRSIPGCGRSPRWDIRGQETCFVRFLGCGINPKISPERWYYCMFVIIWCAWGTVAAKDEMWGSPARLIVSALCHRP